MAKKTVFVSYAHVDDVVLPTMKRGWVTTLLDCLGGLLDQHLEPERRNGTWFAPRSLAGNEDVRAAIASGLEGAETLVVVLSPAYLQSKWCKRELRGFLEGAREQERRVFVIEREPIPREKWPPALRRVRGYRFFSEDSPTPTPLGFPEPTAEDRLYHQRLWELACTLAKEVSRLETKPGGAAGGSSGPTVFLAEAPRELGAGAEVARGYLEQADIEVLPLCELPKGAAAFQARVDHDLRESALFVQLVAGALAGRPRKQYELARALRLRTFQWVDPARGGGPAPGWSGRDPPRPGVGDSRSLLRFLDEVVRTAWECQRASARPAPGNGKPVILVDAKPNEHRPDKLLRELKAMKATCMLQQESAQEWRRWARSSDGVLVVYEADPLWVERRLDDCLKERALSQKRTTSLAVFDRHLPGRSPLSLEDPEIQIFDGRDRRLARSLRSFVEQLGG
jgi:hypothetical protein